MTENKKEYIGEQIVPLVDEFNTFIFMNDRNYKLLKDIYSKFSKKLKELIDSANVDKIGEILFTHNGIKNYIHIKLKEPKNKEDDSPAVQKVFCIGEDKL